MLGVDAPERVELAGARGLAAVIRRAELLQMQIGNAVLVEDGGKLALGEPGGPRCRDRRVSTKSLTLARFNSAITAAGLACS